MLDCFKHFPDAVNFFMLQLVVDYNDLMRIPVVNDYVRKSNQDGVRLR